MISQTDKNFKEMLEAALEGDLVTNRTGVQTLSTLGIQKRYDLRKGFPIVQAKQTFWKKAVAEMLWFLSSECDNIAGLEAMGARNIWEPWADKDGSLNRIYGVQWVDWQSVKKVVKVPPKKIEKKQPSCDRVFNLEDVVDNDELCGKKLESKNFGSFVVLSDVGRDDNGRQLFDVQFEATGFVARRIRRDVVLDGRVKDPYFPNVCGVGCFGEPKEKAVVDKDLRQNLYKTWSHMIERCYNDNCKEFVYYGEKGIHVCERWLCFADFLDDCSKLPNWYRKRKSPKQFQLDKDYYSSNCYHPETTVWLNKSDQMVYRDARPFVAKRDGYEELFISKAKVKRDLQAPKVCNVLNGKAKTSGGYSFEYIDDNSPHRYALPINQLQNALNSVKAHSDSRRIIVSAWRPDELDEMALPPCHVLFQFTVRNGGLYLHLYQRSCDLPIGGPFNVAQYSALLMMFAQLSGLEAREFIHSIHDAHIYVDQVPAVERWIENAKDLEIGAHIIHETPQLKIQERGQTEIEHFTLDDFSMESYAHMGKLVIPVTE